MTAVRACRRCGADLLGEAPGGLCPFCADPPEPAESVTHADVQAVTGPFAGQIRAPSPTDLAVHFPTLEILELLGQGGMGTVYKARQLKLGRLVALKILSPGEAPGSFAERFLREAQALARLNHPNIVTVHDFGEAGPLYYFVMEFVEGGSLRQHLQTARHQPADVVSLVVQMCDALQYAHDEGIIHRDIKPENILLDRRGRIKIADFGLAKLLGPAPAFSLTASQQVMGTLHYMAPEQWEKAHTVDHRADLYSLGVVFYELLTGELPLGRFPLPSQRAAVSPHLDEVVLRALEKDPQRRYQSAGEMKATVEAAAGNPGPMPGPVQLDTLAVRTASPSQAPTQVLDIRHDAMEAARRQVSGPAGGLLIAGLLAAFQPLPHFLLFGLSWLTSATLLGAVFGVVSFLAARKMRQLEAPELALVGSILALIPLGPAWAVGLPMGTWALLVLNKPEVQAALAVPKPVAPSFDWGRLNPRVPVIWSELCCALGAVASALPWLFCRFQAWGPGPNQRAEGGGVYRIIGLLTWHGMITTLLFLGLGIALLASRRNWSTAVSRWTEHLLSLLRYLLAWAGLILVLFLALLIGLQGSMIIPGHQEWVAIAPVLLPCFFLIALLCLRANDWRPLAKILIGLTVIGMIGLLFLQAGEGRVDRWLLFSPQNDIPKGWRWAGSASAQQPGPLLALMAAAGLVVLGGLKLLRPAQRDKP